MKPIVLVALNARWTHTALGARCLLANLGELASRAHLLELTASDEPQEVVEQVLALDPALVGLGVYIWNVTACSRVVRLLKRLRPDLQLVIGGPEVSFFPDDAPSLAAEADWVIAGEAEEAFATLCRQLLRGRPPQGERIIQAPLPDLDRVQLPYHLYDDDDIGRRTIYIEASRGCPFGCELCLSGRAELSRVRRLPTPALLAVLEALWRRGVRHFKFVDRALHLAISPEILGFFLERWEEGTFVHFELRPDLLPPRLGELLARFPAGGVQVEAGVQTFDRKVAERIGRRQDLQQTEDTLRFLRRQTGVHVHADLVAGLPGESLQSFAAGFDRLLALAPHEIQIGLLKRLRGTAISRHDQEWGMVWSPDPPYEVLRTGAIDFANLRRVQRFARYFDLVANSGRFPATAQLLLAGGSPFARFLQLSDWLWQHTGQSHALAQHRLARLLYTFLTEERRLPADEIQEALAADYRRAGRPPIPLTESGPSRQEPQRRTLPVRQQRRQ